MPKPTGTVSRMANGSQTVQELQTLQRLANASPQVADAKALQRLADQFTSSPLVQRQGVEVGVSGSGGGLPPERPRHLDNEPHERRNWDVSNLAKYMGPEAARNADRAKLEIELNNLDDRVDWIDDLDLDDFEAEALANLARGKREFDSARRECREVEEALARFNRPPVSNKIERLGLKEKRDGLAAKRERAAAKVDPMKSRYHRAERAIFREFGNEHRRKDINPDVVGEAQGGIHRAQGQDARPEDAPAVNEFRVRFHKLHSAKLYLEKTKPDGVRAFETANAELLNDLSLRDRFLELAGAVKDASKTHKRNVRDLSNESSIGDLNAQYNAVVNGYGDQALAIAEAITAFLNQQGEDQKDLDDIHAAGTDIWRKLWHRAILAVNGVLHGRWPHWRGKLQDWTRAKHDQDRLEYMDPAQIVGLDYIGSLAKGYKGPPKQAVRYMPEKFDVDANLKAPPLAAYALTVGNAIIDRGRIWSHVAGPGLYPGVIKDMEVDIQQHLERAGLIGMGMDPNEPFEVVVDAEGVDNLPHVPREAVASKTLTEKDQRIRDSIFWLRQNDPAKFRAVAAALRQSDYAVANLLKEHDDENQEYAYTDEQLDAIQHIIDGV